MMIDRLVLACDGGGATSTVVLAAESSRPGEYLAELELGSTNQNRVGADAAALLLRDARREVLQMAGLPDEVSVAVAVFGLAGIDSEADQTAMLRKLSDVAQRVVVENATILALPGATGIALVAGTGSNCFGRNGEGKLGQAGGNGYDYDEGGGAWIARHALGVASKINDGRITAPAGSNFMTEVYAAAQASVQSQLESGTIKPDDLGAAEQCTVARFSDLHHLLYRLDPAIKRQLHGDIVPRVFDLAESGSTEALSILHQGAYELALHIRAVAGSLSMRQADVALTGSLLVKRPLYRQELRHNLDDTYISNVVSVPHDFVVVGRPVEAAVQYAKELLP